MMPPNMKKHIVFKSDARAKLVEGVELLANAVVTTLGPKGRNVAIMRQWGLPIVVHDGVTVAREVDVSDPLVEIGVLLVREAASKTNEEAGDGTTTSILLAHEIVKEGLKLVDKGTNPMVLREKIMALLPRIREELKKLAKPVKGKEDITRVAFISSADEEIGKLVAEAVNKVGKDGLVTADESKGLDTYVEYTEGMEFDKGYVSPYFVTNAQRMESVIEKPVIALVDKKISLNNEIVPILEAMAKESKDMVIIAEDITGDALATIAANKMKGNVNALAVNAPGIGDNKTNYLADLATLTGGKVLSDKTNMDVSKPEVWGHADRVISSRETTVVIGGKGDKKVVNQRIADLRAQRDQEESKFEKEKIEERLARMSTGVGVIKVGAKTEIDMRERIERVKDAIGAAEAARDEGIVPGGGTVFLRLKKILGNSEAEELLKRVFDAPVRKLMSNSGEDEKSINLKTSMILANTDPNYGYEVKEGKLMDLMEAGIIDPVKVVRLALENAVAVACSILTTDALIGLEILEEKNVR